MLSRANIQLQCSLNEQRLPMTHSPETGTLIDSIFLAPFLVHVSCKSGTGFVWYQISTPIRTLFYPNFLPLATISAIEGGRLGEFIAYVAFSYVCFRRQRYMYMVRETGAENRRQKMDSIYGAGFCSVCHGY